MENEPWGLPGYVLAFVVIAVIAIAAVSFLSGPVQDFLKSLGLL